MQLRFNSPYLSISPFDPIELPRFSVITGVNGAGKSHLLRAISEGHALVDGVERDDIVLFSNENFRLENQNELTTDQAIQERNAAWELLNQTQNYNLIGNLKSFHGNLHDSSERIAEIASNAFKPLWKLGVEDGLTEEEAEKLNAYKRQVQSYLVNHPQLKGNHQAISILTLCKKSEKFVDDLSKSQFYHLYEPRQFRENFLPTQLTLAFADYYSKLEENQYNRFRNSTYSEEHVVLSDEDFIKRHGPRPWDVINQVLSQLGTIPYRVNSPEGFTRFDRF
jgi:hypothetical protein